MMTSRVTTRAIGVDGILPDVRVEEVAEFRAKTATLGTRFRWWCLILVTGGSGRIRFGDGPWRALPEGAYVQVAAGDEATYGPAGAPFDHRYVSFAGPEVARQRARGLVPAPGTVHRGLDRAVLRRVADELHVLLAQRRPQAQDRAWLRTCELLVALLHERRRSRTPVPAAVQDLIDAIDAAPEREFDLAAWARAHRISLPHLRATFRAATGHAPGRYQAHRRCERARELLRAGELPIAAVGAAVGLPHPVSFARFFKRLAGTTPSQWRRERIG